MQNKNISVLLVEDNPAQYALLSAYLEKNGYRVLHASVSKALKS